MPSAKDKQNRSHAVMAQRGEPLESLDFFPTPPWATRALCELVLPSVDPLLASATVWEPACGQGHMAAPLQDYAAQVICSDIHPYGYGDVLDFLAAPPAMAVDWVITNPPFKLAEAFLLQALKQSRRGVALLVRSTFLEGIRRYHTVFSPHPPALVAQFTERVPMVKGRYDPQASTATAYCWLVWRKGCNDAPRMTWIPPCKGKFERPSDSEIASPLPSKSVAG